jgi:NAD(P)-dependent dehydrogenase (short-subunit alcohol dehydrogenase family)
MIDAIAAQLVQNEEARTNAIKDRIASRSIQRRLLDPEEIAHMAVYLASDQARGITGQAINVCGGTVLF